MRAAQILTLLTNGSTPPPFTDDFARPDGALGNGWLGGASWAIVSGKAVNTPTEPVQYLTDPGIEDWSSATDAVSYAESIAGTSTINRESSDVHGGTYAVRLDIDSSNSAAQFSQSPTVVKGFTKMVAWCKASIANTRIQMRFSGTLLNLSTSYAKKVETDWTGGTSQQVYIRNNSAASRSIYGDDFSLTVVSLAEALSVRAYPSSDVDCGAALTFGAVGHRGGVAICIDDAVNPQNGIIAYYEGDDGVQRNMKLSKIVAGTLTNLISTALIGVPGAVVEIRKQGTSVSLWYNAAQIGPTQTVSDAGIVNNRYHGILSTDPTILLDNFFVHP